MLVTKDAENAFSLAAMEAVSRGSKIIRTEHVLYGVLKEETGLGKKLLGKYADLIFNELQKSLRPVKTEFKDVQVSPSKDVQTLFYFFDGDSFSCKEILLGLIKVNCLAKKIMSSVAPLDEIEKQIMKVPMETETHSALKFFGKDLCQMASEGKIDPMIGREEELRRLIQILVRKTKNNPCLIGEAGVGKTAIVEGLASAIVKKMVPKQLQEKKIISLNLGAIVAGCGMRGQFEARMQTILEEAKAKNIIIFLDEIHTIIGTGNQPGNLDAGHLIKPALARGEISCIGATTFDEFKIIEEDKALRRRFCPVVVEEPSHEDTKRILMGIKPGLERHHELTISLSAINQAIELSSRYMNESRFPDKAIDLLDESCSFVRIGRNWERSIKQKEISIKNFKIRETVKTRDVQEVASMMTGIPLSTLNVQERQKLLNLKLNINKMVIGQETAVSSLSKAVMRGKAGLKDPKKPIGSFLFLGPTGVGKTWLAKVLAHQLFDSEDNLYRIDMSEYMEKHATSRLIGAPPGYIGYEKGGTLTEAIRRQPYKVILCDEIEKAHPDVLDLFLQIMEEGTLTDHLGYAVSFKNTFIIMSSNVGAEEIKTTPMGFNSQQKNDSQDHRITNEMKRWFKPEFINRFDKIIVFNSLSKNDQRKILELELQKTKDKLRPITLNISEDGKDFLLEKGFNSEQGARPLQRIITSLIEDPISELIIRKNLKKGLIQITKANGQLEIQQ